MLTPQEITSKEFVKAVFGGYDMGAVDEFIEAISADYSVLYKENAILKSKIKVLVEKVEEYRSTEDAMRMALLTAQKMGDDLMAEAREKSEKLLEEVQDERSKKLAEIDRRSAEEQYKLKAAKARTAEYVAAVRKMMEQQNEFLASLDSLDVPEEVAPAPVPPTKEEQILDTARTINDAVAKIVGDEPSVPAEEPAPAPAMSGADKMIEDIVKSMTPDEPEYDDDSEPTKVFSWQDDTSPRPKFDFNDLKFGKNYKDN